MFTTLASSPKFNSQWKPGALDQVSGSADGQLLPSDYDYAKAFSGIDGLSAARMNPDGSFSLFRPGSGSLNDFTARATINPDGTVSIGDWSERNLKSAGQMALEGGALAALAAGGLGAAGFFGGGVGAGGLSGMDLAADAALGSGNNIITAGQALSGAGGIAGTGIPAYTQGAGYGNNVATLADASGASPFTSGATYDPVSAYLTNGASEGSTIGNAFTGAGGSAGAVGAGTTAGTLGTIGNALGSVGNLMGKKTINGFGLGDALSLGGNLLNSYLGYNAANKAADAQVNAANQANQLAKYMYDQTRQDNMPALEARNAGLTGYQNLLKDPSSVTQDPGYQFGFNQGMNAYDNSGAARGMRLSGAQAKALTRYGQDYAGTKYNEALGRYGQLAGIGQPGTNTIAGAGQNYSNQFSQNTTGAGNAAASGYIGGANAISGGISNFLRNWQESNLLKQLGIGG